MSKLETNQVDPATGTTLTLGTSGDTIDIPSGVTLDTTGATVTGLTTGKILQVVTATDSANYSITSTSFVNSSNGLTLNITPSATSSKVFVQVSVANMFGASGQNLFLTIYRDSTNLGGTNGMAINGGFNESVPVSMSILDSPSTTSSTTYQVYARVTGGTSDYGNGNAVSTITAFEIAG
jgi:hypothetical protein|tara:strand:+ start:41 stop:580 length:540 start_codon:yes stop_codon:yes gene_type:complete